MELRTFIFTVNLVLSLSNQGESAVLSDSDLEATENSGSSSLVHSRVQQNFQNLIDSVAKSDSRRSELYRDVLKQNVANGQRAFDAVKDEIQATRSRNVRRRTNHIESETHQFGNISPAKRELDHHWDEDDEDFDLKVEDFGSVRPEDLFLEKFGNDVNTSGIWPEIRRIASDEERLKNISYQAHAIVWTRFINIGKASVVVKTLNFADFTHKDINADMLEYVLLRLPERPFLLTKGLRPDCVFHMWKVGYSDTNTYQLQRHVCNITFY